MSIDSQKFESLVAPPIRHLQRLRRLTATGRWVTLALASSSGALLLAGLVPLPSLLRLGLLAIEPLILIQAYRRWLHQPLWENLALPGARAQALREIESAAQAQGQNLENRLINSHLLLQDTSEASTSELISANRALWIHHAVDENLQALQAIKLGKFLSTRPAKRAWMKAAATGLGALALLLAFPGLTRRGLAALTHPYHWEPHQGQVQILSVDPGNQTVVYGQSVDVSVQVDSGLRAKASLFIRTNGGQTQRLAMAPAGSENRSFLVRIPAVKENLSYMVSVSDTQSPFYQLTTREPIRLTAPSLEITPPQYTRLPPRKLLADPAKPLEIPQGSQVKLTADRPPAVSGLLLDAPPAPAQVLTAAGSAPLELVPQETSNWRLIATDTAGRSLAAWPLDPERFRVEVLNDRPPAVILVAPEGSIEASAGQKLAVVLEAADDYGLTEIRLESAREEGTFVPVQRWALGTEAKAQLRHRQSYTLEVPPAPIGSTLQLRAVAVDNRKLPNLGPQESASPLCNIRIIDGNGAATQEAKVWGELQEKLRALLTLQQSLRKSDWTAPALEPLRRAGNLVKVGQERLAADLKALTTNYPFKPSQVGVQKSLQRLETQEAPVAIDRARDLSLLGDLRNAAPAARKLDESQAKIVDLLEALLGIAELQEKKARAQNEDNSEALASNAAQDAWKKVLGELPTLEKDQKMALELLADLARKPQSQFDQADMAKLAQAESLADKWEKFLTQTGLDISKIGQQDLTGLSLLEELVKMKVELALAKGAMEAKRVEIATPLEANGLEDAKSLTTHIERWLEQTPDRAQWKMEDALDQHDATMAALPDQLQDMIGDLMDQEEDVTEAMEDVGSKFNDSGDKGIGWGAADGPISNMTAGGVTGNQLPNNNEIQGRSGEGREGRASGEMVGNEAEGKGGRRTPTRMTSEAFGSGQVKDKSKEPAGGATGGGKKAGFGGQGLEGQGPNTPENPLQRMASQQAALRDKARQVAVEARNAGYSQFKLMEAAVLMRKSEESLRRNDYRNALLQQHLSLQSLNTAGLLAGSSARVTVDRDAAAELPRKVQEALQGPLPAGWSDPIKAYFVKLSRE